MIFENILVLALLAVWGIAWTFIVDRIIFNFEKTSIFKHERTSSERRHKTNQSAVTKNTGSENGFTR